MKQQIYCDYAAATPLDDAVAKAMEPFHSHYFHNPSAIYLSAKPAKEALQAARAGIAMLLGARPGEIIFTAGGTESNNLALSGVLRRYPETQLLISAIEHDSVLKCAAQFHAVLITVNQKGILDPGALHGMITDKTVMISVMLANSEIGALQPVHEVAQIIKEVVIERRVKGNKLPLFLHTDACQAAGTLELNVHRLGVDLLTFNGSKIYGPKQAGILYVRAGIQLEPLLYGGGQEFGLRSGTENVAAAVGLAEAFKLAQHLRNDENKRLTALRDDFIKQVLNSVSSASLNGPTKNRLPGNAHFSFEGQDNERLIFELDERGIACSAGSACSASSDEPSHVLKAIGLTDDQARSSLRFSFGRQTTAEELDIVAQQLADIINSSA